MAGEHFSESGKETLQRLVDSDFEAQAPFIESLISLAGVLTSNHPQINEFFAQRPRAVAIFRELVAKYTQNLNVQSGGANTVDFISRMKQKHAGLPEGAGLIVMLALAYAKKSGLKVEKGTDSELNLVFSNAFTDFDEFVQKEKGNYQGEDFKDVEQLAALFADVGIAASRQATRAASVDARNNLRFRQVEAMVGVGARVFMELMKQMPSFLKQFSDKADQYFKNNPDNLPLFKEIAAKYMAGKGLGSNAFDIISRQSGQKPVSEAVGLLIGIAISFAAEKGRDIKDLNGHEGEKQFNSAMEDFFAFIEKHRREYPSVDFRKVFISFPD